MNKSLIDRVKTKPSCFPVSESAVEVLTADGPTGFHRKLRQMIRSASRRISLGSLYLGTGQLEVELLEDIRFALRRSPNLQVQIVLDHSRARRNTPNGTSVSFTHSLLREYPSQVALYLHRMPQFRGMATWLPSPLNECLAVCHFKALTADDATILTGANLSDEYFHCRQARYLLVRDSAFVEMTDAFVTLAAQHSHRILPATNGRAQQLDCELDPRGLGDAVLRCVSRFESPPQGHTTYLVPVFQHPELGMQQERDLLCEMLAWPDGDLVITTPYPNFPSAYVDAIKARLGNSGPAQTMVIAPSGNCHGFSTGRGPKALVPGIYRNREQDLVERVRHDASSAAEPGTLELRHYERPGWVFHSKGVWFTTPDACATVIGSSSFGERSVLRDFDMSCLLVTNDPGLRQDLLSEVSTVLAHASGELPVVRPGSWAVPLLVPLAKRFL